jgi:hypothetical protein
MGTAFWQPNNAGIMASHHWSLLEALGRNIHKFRRPTVSDDFYIREGQDVLGSSHGMKLFDLRQRFETQLLMLVEKRTIVKNFQLLTSPDAQDLTVELNTLLCHLERALNAAFQAESAHGNIPADKSVPHRRRLSRIDHAIAVLDRSKETVVLTGSHNLALFELSNLNDARNAHASVALVNGILQRNHSTTSLQAASRTTEKISRTQEAFTEWVQSFGKASNERLKKLLDTIAKDFDDCDALAGHTVHAVRTQLLNYDVQGLMPRACLKFCLLCPNMGDWQIARCEFETYVLLNSQTLMKSNQPPDKFMVGLGITIGSVSIFRHHKA